MTRRAARVGLVIGTLGIGVVGALYGAPLAGAQGIDCARLAAQISALARSGGGGGSGQYAAAAQRQRAELARTSAYASSIGCNKPDFFLFGERPSQCGAINGQIARMQANLQSLSQAAGGDNGRAGLQARFDAYCRGGDANSPRGFFEQLFGGGSRPAYDDPQPDIMQPYDEDADRGSGARGGSQAVCVRTCDGGFFPLSVGARQRAAGELQDLCAAQCPGVETKLYTRVPGSDISTAASLSGEAYTDLPNALKFQKSFDRTCTCKPADKSWTEVLANAERILGDERRGDILVTPEKAEELSRIAGPAGAKAVGRKFDPRAIAKTIAPVPSATDAAAPTSGPSADGGATAFPSDAGRGGVRVIPR